MKNQKKKSYEIIIYPELKFLKNQEDSMKERQHLGNVAHRLVLFRVEFKFAPLELLLLLLKPLLTD